MHDVMRLLAERGYAAAAVSYRLTRAPRNVFPAAVDDARCAVRWLRANAAALGLDALTVSGHKFAAPKGVGAVALAEGAAAIASRRPSSAS